MKFIPFTDSYVAKHEINYILIVNLLRNKKYLSKTFLGKSVLFIVER